MDDGLSLTWGEIIKASDLDYNLTSALQMVCPICKAPVFKVERKKRDGTQAHYLAHHSAKASDRQNADDCERRILAIGRSGLDAIAALSRGQTIDAFIGQARSNLIQFVLETHPTNALPDPATALDRLLSLESFVTLATGNGTRLKQEFQKQVVTRAYLAGLISNPDKETSWIKDILLSSSIKIGLKDYSRADQFASDLAQHLVRPEMCSCLLIYLAAASYATVAMERGQALTEANKTLLDRFTTKEFVASLNKDQITEKLHMTAGSAYLEAMLISKTETELHQKWIEIRKAFVKKFKLRTSIQQSEAEKIILFSAKRHIIKGLLWIVYILPLLPFMREHNNWRKAEAAKMEPIDTWRTDDWGSLADYIT